MTKPPTFHADLIPRLLRAFAARGLDVEGARLVAELRARREARRAREGRPREGGGDNHDGCWC